MPTTGAPSSVWYPDDQAPIAPLENLFLQLATSVNVAFTNGGVNKVADLAALGAISGALGDAYKVAEGGAIFIHDGTKFVQRTPAAFSSAANRDTAYAKASGAYRVPGATAWRSDANSIDRFVGTAWALDDTGWQNLSLASGWSVYNSETPQYRRVNGATWMRGRATRTAGAGLTIGIVDAGYRPSANLAISTASDTSSGSVQIATDGSVSAFFGSGSNMAGLQLGALHWLVN